MTMKNDFDEARGECACGRDDPAPRQDVVGAMAERMVHYWNAGLRPHRFQETVRTEFPDCTLTEFNGAAAIAWEQVNHDA